MNDSALPGADLVERGLADLARGVESIESLLVSIAAPRLRAVGHVVPSPQCDPELKLYHRLREKHGDAAHGRYNALVRRLVSYSRAACVR